MPNTKSVGVAFSDPELTAGTTIDGATLTNCNISLPQDTITADDFVGDLTGIVGGTTPAAATVTALVATSVANSGPMVNSSVQALAAAGADNTDAGAVTATARTVVVSAADGTKGIILPASVIGKEIQIKNNAAAVLKIYPPASSAINALTATTGSLDIASLTTVTLVCTGATQWFSFPLLPS